jgi:hypothetical protein
VPNAFRKLAGEKKNPGNRKSFRGQNKPFSGIEEEGLCSGRIKESQSLRRRFIKL